MRKILIPLDDSPFSRQILPQVIELFSPATSEIILFRAARAPDEVMDRYPDDLPPRPILIYARQATAQIETVFSSQAWEEFEGALRRELEPAMRELHKAGYLVTIAAHFGEPAKEIVRVAREEGVALVAMATHGRTGLGRLLKGSVAEGVLHGLSNVPLLLLHAEVERRSP